MFSGAVIGFFLGLAIVLAFMAYVRLRGTPPLGADIAQETQSFEVTVPPPEVFRVFEALPASVTRYKPGPADASMGRIMLQEDMTLMGSYGYFYPVSIAPSGTGSIVTVGIKSKYPLQFGPLVKRQREKALSALIDAAKRKLGGVS